MRFAAGLLLIAITTGCNSLFQLPESKGISNPDAEYPSFVPLSDVNLEEIDTLSAAQETEEELARRAASLRARASRLKSTQIP
ncbi:MAG: hypothetical protein ABJ360_27225 [Roseobacter sp.]